jgi:hypothetical protein
MDQIQSDKELARDARRAIVHGGPGHRITKNGVQTGIVFTGQNTGQTVAFTKWIYWGVCKQAEWPDISKNWIGRAKQREWEEILPPKMKPAERYVVDFTATPIQTMASATFATAESSTSICSEENALQVGSMRWYVTERC